jgi:phosphate transport system substrate-binding protein
MKIGIRRLLYLLLIVPFLACCTDSTQRMPTAHKRSTVTIAGSTSIMPFSEKLAEHFKIERPRITVDVQGGGSSAGIQACMNKTVDVGMSSRALKGDEKVLKEIAICHDGIAIIVHPGNPIQDVDIDRIKEIYAGRITNWKQLGWIDRQIDSVTREEGSGTRGAFEELVMAKTEINDRIMVQDSNGSVKEVVATDPYAIGYISLGVVDAKVKALTVGGIAPTVKNILAKRYRIVRPFLYLTSGKPTESAQLFINYVLSKEGQKILKKEGLIPINE